MISINNKKLKTILLIVGGSLLMCSLALSTGFLLNYAALSISTRGKAFNAFIVPYHGIGNREEVLEQLSEVTDDWSTNENVT